MVRLEETALGWYKWVKRRGHGSIAEEWLAGQVQQAKEECRPFLVNSYSILRRFSVISKCRKDTSLGQWGKIGQLTQIIFLTQVIHVLHCVLEKHISDKSTWIYLPLGVKSPEQKHGFPVICINVYIWLYIYIISTINVCKPQMYMFVPHVSRRADIHCVQELHLYLQHVFLFATMLGPSFCVWFVFCLGPLWASQRTHHPWKFCYFPPCVLFKWDSWAQ